MFSKHKTTQGVYRICRNKKTANKKKLFVKKFVRKNLRKNNTRDKKNQKETTKETTTMK